MYEIDNHDVVSNEKDIIAFWREKQVFQQSLDITQEGQSYIMYDGPPFATGLPHYGHVLAHTIKDIFPRFKTMHGNYVARPFGWDCHGVPIEHMVQQQFMDEGIHIDTSTPEGIAQFNERCQSVVLKYTQEWKETEERFGRFVDMDTPYRTMDSKYIESVWSVFATLHKKGLVDERLRVVAYSPALHTALSDFEAKENYKKIKDPAITIAFPLVDQPDVSLLVWTTTPWTVISNIAVAVNVDLDYVLVSHVSGNKYIISASLVEKSFKEKDILEVTPINIQDFIGKKYQPLFSTSTGEKENEYTVIPSKHVSAQDGTGLVHISPAFGEDDFNLGQQFDLPALDFFDAEGQYVTINNHADLSVYEKYQQLFDELRGVNFKDADKRIVQFIRELNRLVKHEVYEHDYPCCWRTDKPLMYRAMPSWYVGVTAIKEDMVKLNKTINWYPDAVGSKRFHNWLENARDWCISRDRFWGSPIPIWRNINDPSDVIIIGSKAELEALSNQSISDDLHRQHIDHVEILRDGKTYKRIPQVFDCWFESGSMPYAQVGYMPHQATQQETDAFLQKNFPADFIAEGLDQTRGWFYTLLILSTALFNKVPFKNCIVNGILLGSDKKKMSKSKRNYPALDAILEQYGADALRFVLMKSAATCAESMSIAEDLFKQATSDLLIPIKNIYRFFAENCNKYEIYPSIDFNLNTVQKSELDAWLLMRTEKFKNNVSQALENYNLIDYCNEILGYVQEFSRWYVRHIKDYFSQASIDQKYVSLHCMQFALHALAHCAAPVIPFMSEYLYRSLFGYENSIHLQNWLSKKVFADEVELQQRFESVEAARVIVSLTYGIRESNNVPLKQPLRKITLDFSLQAIIMDCIPLINKAANVESIDWIDASEKCKFNVSLNFSVVGRKLRQHMQIVNKLIQDKAYTLNHDNTELCVSVHDDLLNIDKMYTLDASQGEFSLVTNESKNSARVGKIWVELDTQITEELLHKGYLRALTREIMTMRKTCELSHDDKIGLVLTGGVYHLLENHEDLDAFCRKTNAKIFQEEPDFPATQKTILHKLNQGDFTGSSISFYILKRDPVYSSGNSSSVLYVEPVSSVRESRVVENSI